MYKCILCVCVYLCSVDQLPLSIVSFFEKLQEWIRLPKCVLKKRRDNMLLSHYTCLSNFMSGKVRTSKVTFLSRFLASISNTMARLSFISSAVIYRHTHTQFLSFLHMDIDMHGCNMTCSSILMIRWHKLCTYSDGSFPCRFAFLQLQRSAQSFTGNYLKHTKRRLNRTDPHFVSVLKRRQHL